MSVFNTCPEALYWAVRVNGRKRFFVEFEEASTFALKHCSELVRFRKRMWVSKDNCVEIRVGGRDTNKTADTLRGHRNQGRQKIIAKAFGIPERWEDKQLLIMLLEEEPLIRAIHLAQLKGQNEHSNKTER